MQAGVYDPCGIPPSDIQQIVVICYDFLELIFLDDFFRANHDFLELRVPIRVPTTRGGTDNGEGGGGLPIENFVQELLSQQPVVYRLVPAPAVTTVSLTDREILNFWVQFSAPRWNNLRDMPITDLHP